MRDYEINSDLKQSKFESLKFVQGDTGSKIIVNLFEDSQTVNLSNCTVLAKYKRSDGYTDNKEATITDNTITVEVDETMTAIVGTLKLIFEITYETTKKVSTFMLLADISEGIGAKSTTGGGTGDVVVDVDLSNYYNKQEIDKKLDNIANEKVDKVDGKGLSTNDYTTSEKQKLEGLSNYVHPSTHDASIINQDSTHRFVTDEEKSKWNSATGVTQEQIDSAVTSYLTENPVTGGLTTTAKDLLITILRNAMYTTNQSANITALESALASSESGGESGGDTPTVTTYTITNNLTNCINSNTETTVAENSSYVTTITPSDGYTLTDASVNITMGGIDITSTAYSNGTINIASVTGDIVITISTMQIPQTIYYTITNNLTNCTSNNNKTNTQENTSYTATISPSSGYTLTDASISVTMGGVDVTSTVYNNGVINISSVTGNVVITISAVKIALSVNEISPSYLTVKNRRTININNPDAMLTEMPDTISFIAKDVDQYWSTSTTVCLNVRDNVYTQTPIKISYTKQTLTVDGIIYAVITITKADYTTAYNTYKGYIDNDGKIAYNLNSISFGNSDNKFNENYLPKIVDNSVDKNVISSLTW